MQGVRFRVRSGSSGKKSIDAIESIDYVYQFGASLGGGIAPSECKYCSIASK
jgi:hypothetical protein